MCRQCDNRGEGEGLGFLLAYLWQVQGHAQPDLHTRTHMSVCTHKHTHTFPHLPLHPLSSSVHMSTQSPAVQRVDKNPVTTLTLAHQCLLCQARRRNTQLTLLEKVRSTPRHMSPLQRETETWRPCDHTKGTHSKVRTATLHPRSYG